MIVYKGLLDQILKLSPSVATIGNFDGLHKGHQELIKRTLAVAHEKQLSSVVYTFRPHPQIALKPHEPLPLILDYEERQERFEKTGIDILIEEPFSREFSDLSAEDFFHQVLVNKVSLKHLIVGHDFRFGRSRLGHFESLRDLCALHQVELEIVDPLWIQGKICSSSLIRSLIQGGHVEEVPTYLGRPFFYRGVVIRGHGRGRAMGFPTANVQISEKIRPPTGVYVTRTLVQGRIYNSITNVGYRPTFQDAAPALSIETHLLKQDLDLYGESMEVSFLTRLRDEKKFPSLDPLLIQIRQDCFEAEKMFLTNRFLLPSEPYDGIF